VLGRISVKFSHYIGLLFSAVSVILTAPVYGVYVERYGIDFYDQRDRTNSTCASSAENSNCNNIDFQPLTASEIPASDQTFLDLVNVVPGGVQSIGNQSFQNVPTGSIDPTTQLPFLDVNGDPIGVTATFVGSGTSFTVQEANSQGLIDPFNTGAYPYPDNPTGGSAGQRGLKVRLPSGSTAGLTVTFTTQPDTPVYGFGFTGTDFFDQGTTLDVTIVFSDGTTQGFNLATLQATQASHFARDPDGQYFLAGDPNFTGTANDGPGISFPLVGSSYSSLPKNCVPASGPNNSCFDGPQSPSGISTSTFSGSMITFGLFSDDPGRLGGSDPSIESVSFSAGAGATEDLVLDNFFVLTAVPSPPPTAAGLFLLGALSRLRKRYKQSI
jgi:hypothetical protein